MNRFICVHGHFYQPPRENPWTGLIDVEETAAPYGNWNERIHAECYAPNTHTQILNNQNKAIETVNNYSNISFNFGPTLLTWMAQYASETYAMIIEADRKSQAQFSGHGSAMAQVYNHVIMPLANDRDQQTQVIWGIKDFEFRFGRKPEGMWLSETAVNVNSLETLASNGILFTILAPNQAKRVKDIHSDDWIDVSDGSIDTQQPYLCRLPSGKPISLFFYNGNIANEVAFEQLLKNGVRFADRMVGEFTDIQEGNSLVHIANDGETYGHHHVFGNMALAYMLYHVEINRYAQRTIYGEYLAGNPPQLEVEIIEDTSWSCYHGIQRWQDHCGCSLNQKENWNQSWRKSLRESLDWLRDELVNIFEPMMRDYYPLPWDVRNDYIHIVLNNSKKNQKKWLWDTAARKLTGHEKGIIINLLEMQRYAMLMYTSCGWFFDDISRIEAIQILRYAGRAIQLARETNGCDLESEFCRRLSFAVSNKPEMVNGEKIYQMYVKTAMRDVGLKI